MVMDLHHVHYTYSLTLLLFLCSVVGLLNPYTYKHIHSFIALAFERHVWWILGKRSERRHRNQTQTYNKCQRLFPYWYQFVSFGLVVVNFFSFSLAWTFVHFWLAFFFFALPHQNFAVIVVSCPWYFPFDYSQFCKLWKTFSTFKSLTLCKQYIHIGRGI